MKELLEAGVHFGHQTRRWNPKMKEYIFGERNGIHIIDLQKTLKMFREASRFVGELTAQGKNVLFVGTKRQAQEAVAEEAKRCGAFFVNHRWLGGTLTNWATLQKSIKRLKQKKAMNEDGRIKELSKKEQARLDREMKHLFQNLEGIENMVQLLHLTVQPCLFFLGKLFDPAVFVHGLQQLQPLDGFLQRRPVRQRPAQPAVVHEKRTAALRLFGDRFLGLPLGAHE